jgi:hypothetical protein
MRIIKLEGRQIHEGDTDITDEMIMPIDFSFAEVQIGAMREKSATWLRNALGAPKENRPTVYDYIKPDMSKTDSRIDYSIQQLAALRVGLEKAFLPLKGPLESLALRPAGEMKFHAYLNMLPALAKNFLVIVAVKAPPGYRIDAEIVRKMQAAGFKENLQYKHLHSYIGVIDSGKLLYEALGQDYKPTLWEAEVDRYQVQISSMVWRNGDKAEITVNGVDYAVNERGLNIVVFDKRSGCFIDSVCFDTHLSTFSCSRGPAQKWAVWFAVRVAAFHRRNMINGELEPTGGMERLNEIYNSSLSQIAMLEDRVRHKDGRISELEDNLTAAQNTIKEGLNGQLQIIDTLKGRLDGEVANVEEHIDNIRNMGDSIANTHNAIFENMNGQAQRIEALMGRIDGELANAEQRYEDILNSRTWKIGRAVTYIPRKLRGDK